MTTRPSAAATEIASGLNAEGFTGVSPVLVQRWRERGLLGAWTHWHPGGPGSTAIAGSGAYERARLAARLGDADRTPRTVTLLAHLTGIPVQPAEVARALHDLFTPVKAALSSPEMDPVDRAETHVQRLMAGGRSRDRLRALSARLERAPDPQWVPDEPGRSALERTADALTATLAAIGGDVSWVVVVLPDALRLEGFGEVAKAAGLDKPDVLARDGPALEAVLSTTIKALDRLDELTAKDLCLAREVSVTLAGHDNVAEFADSTAPIVAPDAVLGAIIGPLLSQLALPGQLHRKVMQHRS